MELGRMSNANHSSSSGRDRSPTNSVCVEDNKDSANLKDSPNNLLLGAIIDRFCLLVYFLITSVTIIACRHVLF